MNIIIVDSGINLNIIPCDCKGISISMQDGVCMINDNYEDKIGHGTAVTQLILNNIKRKQDVDIFMIKVEGALNGEYSLDLLIYALNYIDINCVCDILVICSGTRVYSSLMLEKIMLLREKGTIIFSAFDNLGSMSYPAAFECVVGIDVTDEKMENENLWVYTEDSVVNIVTYNKNYKVRWIDNRVNIVKGSSFACGDIVGRFADYVLENKEKAIERSLHFFMRQNAHRQEEKRHTQKKQVVKGKKAIVFPFNKEIHSIACNEDLIGISIVNYYDIRQSGKLNIEICKLVPICNNRKVIKNIESLDWESDFDTVIIGHCEKYQRILDYDIRKQIIDNCIRYKKYLFLLDDIDIKQIDSENIYYPCIKEKDIPPNNLGKLYVSGTPVLGIFGTSSQQGKFTLQLMLRRLFMENGYKVGQIGTEPTSLLFGMDYVYPMGYNSTVYTKGEKNIRLLNKYIHECEIKNADIIIIGSQSGTCPYHVYNINLFTLPQLEFLLGTQPDIIVLCVNVCDNIDYVCRTINTLEGVVDCKVIAIALFPRKVVQTSKIISSTALDSEYNLYKDTLEVRFGIPVYGFDIEQVEMLYSYIIDYLS